MTLNRETYEKGLRSLSDRDEDLAGVIREFGPPPIWIREPGFATLVLIILEQQVSLASARAVFERLTAVVSPFTARQFIKALDAPLKRAGITRQKLSYCRHLSEALAIRRLDLKALHHMSDNQARYALMEIKGVGPWTADIYLLRAVRRPDIWPRGDLALAVAMQELKGLRARPTPDESDAMGLSWHPWRAVAARILWHYYLSTRSKMVEHV